MKIIESKHLSGGQLAGGNNMTDKEIMNRVQEHYSTAESLGYEVVGVFLHGSQNYQLDTEDSDIDTKAIVLPKLDDIILNKKLTSFTHVMPDNSHLDLKDIRLIFDILKKQNMSFLEILFTKYSIINPKYKEKFAPIIENNELIAHYNPIGSVKSMRGMALEKYKCMEHPHPTVMNKIEKYGYDPKQLHHIIRLNEFIKRYISGEAYKDCLISKNKEYLIEVKKGLHNLQEARELAKTLSDETNQLRKDYMSTNDIKVNKQVEDILNEVLVDIIKFNFKTELLGELK